MNATPGKFLIFDAVALLWFMLPLEVWEKWSTRVFIRWCAGAQINPGGVVISDSDGVFVAPAIAAQMADTAEWRERIAAGVIGLGLNKLCETL